MAAINIPQRLLVGAAVLVASLTGALASGTLFPAVPYPANNPSSPDKILLGRQLFYDKRLSRGKDVACASCHQQDKAFSVNVPISPGTSGRLATRNPPSLVGAAYRSKLFWHGGSPSLELQAMGPLTDHNEMDMTAEDMAARLAEIPGYVREFQQVFGEKPTARTALMALATFERTLVSYNSPFDRFQAGDLSALSASAQRGMDLFYDKAECFHCHTGGHFSDNQAHNNASELFNEDIGVAQLTGKDEDVGKFITPTLRNVALTAPYMHAGSMKTLREVVENYNAGGQPNANADPLIRPLGLSESEVDDLVAFLNSLTDPTIATNPNFGPPPGGLP